MSFKKKLFDSLNNFFDNIYVITLKRSKERQVRINEILRGLNYEIFWGVDGSKLDLKKIRNAGKYDPEITTTKIPLGRELTPGEIGCALSHLEVYKDIKSNGYQKALILEDDISVVAKTNSKLVQSLAELPQNWEVLYLGYLYNNNAITFPAYLRIYLAYPLLNLLGFNKYSSRKMRCKYPRPYSKNLELAGFHYGTHAYAVSNEGARKILAYQSPVTMAPDNALGMMCMEEAIKAFRVKERVFDQNRELATTITGRYETKLKN